MQTYITERDGLILVVAADGGLNRGTAQQLIEEISKHVEFCPAWVLAPCCKSTTSLRSMARKLACADFAA